MARRSSSLWAAVSKAKDKAEDSPIRTANASRLFIDVNSLEREQHQPAAEVVGTWLSSHAARAAPLIRAGRYRHGWEITPRVHPWQPARRDLPERPHPLKPLTSVNQYRKL